MSETVRPWPTRRLVLVEWADSKSFGDASWRFLDEFAAEISVCESVGFLIEETADVLVLVPHIIAGSGEEQGCGDMRIPKVCVLSMRDLREVA